MEYDFNANQMYQEYLVEQEALAEVAKANAKPSSGKIISTFKRKY